MFALGWGRSIAITSHDRPGKRCPPPFARNSPSGCFARKVPGTFCLLCLTVATGFLPADAAGGEPMPVAPRLLPERTLAYLRLDDAEQLRGDFGRSSLGQMLQDPEMQPFATDVYALAAALFARIGDRIGITLDELVAIPHGQVAIALLAPGGDEPSGQAAGPRDESPEAIRRRIEQRRRQNREFAGVLMIDAGENLDALLTLVDAMEEALLRGGYVRRDRRVETTTLVRWVPPREDRPPLEYFHRDGGMVIGFGDGTVADVLDRWSGKSKSRTLADSADFAAVMGRCIGAEETHPQITFYVDPYRIVERIVQNATVAALIWPIVDDLGIRKIRGIGGSVFRGGETFDDISHLHVLIDTPRDGFFGVLRPATGETTPPNWVPADVTAYTTVHWNVEATVNNFERILDRFQGEGGFRSSIAKPLEDRIGIRIKEDLVAALNNRYVGLRWLEPPIALNSQAQVRAFQVKDAGRAEELFRAYRQQRPNEWAEEAIGFQPVYFARGGGGRVPAGFRQPEPCLLLLGDWFIYSDSREFVARLLRAREGNLPRLASEPDYALVASEMGGKLDGEDPFLVSFIRGSDFIRQLYEMTKSENTVRFLREAGENNPVAAQFYDLLRRNRLPPYERFEKYFAPGGLFGYDQPTGIHVGSFTLRPL